MQKPKLIFFLIFCFSSFFLSAQKNVEVSLYLGGNYSQIDAANTINQSDVRSFHSFVTDSNGDTSLVFAQVRFLSEIGHEFEVLPGADLGLRFEFPVGKKINIQAGFGFSSLSYKPRNPFLSSERDASVDTVFTTGFGLSPTLLTVFNPSCDTIINNPVIVSITETHDIVFLRIPINISYEAIEELLNIHAGLFINTPLYSSERSARFNINRTLRTRPDGTTYYECENSQGTHINTTGDRFRDFTFGANLGINYQLSRKISLGINFSRLFLPFYNEPQSFSGSTTFIQESTKPYLNSGSVRVFYTFGEKKTPSK